LFDAVAGMAHAGELTGTVCLISSAMAAATISAVSVMVIAAVDKERFEC